MSRAMALPWRIRRMSRMGPRELASRLRDQVVKVSWRRLKGKPVTGLEQLNPNFSEIDIAARELAGSWASEALTGFGERLLAGRLPVFGREAPLPQNDQDWF